MVRQILAGALEVGGQRSNGLAEQLPMPCAAAYARAEVDGVMWKGQ